MKRVLALWLAVCMICSLSCVSLAKTPGSSGRDSGESTSSRGFELKYYELAGLTALRNYSARSATENYFGDKLNDNARIIYDALLDHFQAIDSTGSGESLIYIDSGWGLGEDAADDDCLSAFLALLKDHSNLTYWVSMGEGKENAFAYAVADFGSGIEALCIVPVIPAYRDGDPMDYSGTPYYNINANKGGAGQTKEDALAVAADIVSQAGALSTDYEKVRFFNETICDLTSYDKAAAEPDAQYDDASQMINVFLGKPVVCEGYAKAFKYLCDEAGIGCFLVEGLLSNNNHMWNYVELDGKWYIVDVTNNDGSSDIERLLAVGSENANYKGKYDPTQSYDTAGKLTPTLNPDVAPEKGDYEPAETPVEPEKLTLRVQSASSDSLYIGVEDETGAAYDGKYTLAKGDLTVTAVTATGADGKTYQPSAVTDNGYGYYRFDFDPALPAGTYRVSVKEKAGYEVKIDSNTFTVKPRLPDPQIRFGKPDQDGNVTVTIAVPGISSQNISVKYVVNDGMWEQGTSPMSFTISATDPDRYPTKVVKAYAWHDDYESGDEVTASYTFTPDADAFQVIVTPVERLHGFITTKTLMATLSVKNAKGEVTYELDPDKNNYGFQIEGDKVYSEEGFQFDPTDYTVYVIATDLLDSGESPVAYGSAVIHISEKEQGGNDDNNGSDDSDDGSSSGSGGGGGSSSSVSSGNSSTGNADSASAPLSAEQATGAAQAAISAAASTGANNVTVRFSNVSTVPAEAFQSIADAAATANLTASAVFDTVKGNVVEARLILDPAKAAAIAGGVNVAAVVNDPVVAGHFRQFFSNELAVATFAQKGPFGQSVRAALRLDLSKLDTRQLQFYEYNAATNTYKKVSIPWSIDANGYLWATITSGNSLIVTDKPLSLK